MKPFTSVSALIGALLVIVLPTGTILAQTDGDQARVETVAKNIDKDTKEGWGRIAKDMGFKLGPVVSAAEHTRIELIRDLQAAERPAKMEKVERVDRPDRPQRPERPERIERPHR